MFPKCIVLLLAISGYSLYAQQHYAWAVIGAGPAGIISVAQLLEHGVSDDEIMWIDPEFSSGRIGKYYGNVPSNQKAGGFTACLDQSSIFSSINSPAVEVMRARDPEQEYPLQCAANVFIDITNYLCTRVHWQQATVDALWEDQDLWRLDLNGGTVYAEKVILAVGSHPKKLRCESIQEIPLDSALDEEKLQKQISHDDVIMVVGSAHSALLVVKYLHEFGIKKIINVYTKEPTFEAVGGLAGITAYWAQNVLLHNKPENIERVLFGPQTLQQYAPLCTKIIYAFGYEPNTMSVNGSTHLSYDQKTGMIHNNLYGIGIAFPQPYVADDGSYVNLVGFNSFMYRAKCCMPLWLQKSIRENNGGSQQHALCLQEAASEWESRWI